MPVIKYLLPKSGAPSPILVILLRRVKPEFCFVIKKISNIISGIMNNSFWLFGSHHYIIAEGSKTKYDICYDLIEKSSKPGVETPLHIHEGYSELVYVLEGQLTVYTQQKTVVLNPGESVFIPRGVTHSLAATSENMTKTLQSFTPGGFAQLLKTVGTAGTEHEMPPEKPLDMELFNRMCEELGDITLGPPGTRPKPVSDSSDNAA
jgi:mannose-6-phosphate isomerase-like protein (cupin superfamily)